MRLLNRAEQEGFSIKGFALRHRNFKSVCCRVTCLYIEIFPGENRVESRMGRCQSHHRTEEAGGRTLKRDLSLFSRFERLHVNLNYFDNKEETVK